MATILIVDDHPTNREFLVTLLGYGGHRLLEAADGAEGLALSRSERPELIIADILMPTMDGYEFVHQLRADPSIASIPVIFYTAHYHEPGARKLAEECGVTAVLTKPSEPDVVVQTVEAALGQHPMPSSSHTDEFDRDHLQLLTNKLSQKTEEMQRTNERLSAMLELGLQLGSERKPARLLQTFCDAARQIVGARYAVVGILNGGDEVYRHFLTGGMEPGMAARVGRSGPLSGVLGSALNAGHCFRIRDPRGLAAVGLPSSFPPSHSLLAAPVLSPSRVHGWICLLNKVGGEEFGDEDEQVAGILAAQVGRIYENGSLYADLIQHSHNLAHEIAERKRTEHRLRTQNAVVEILAQAADLKEAAPRLLGTVCELTGWNVGNLWVVDRQANVLMCGHTWFAGGDAIAEFCEFCRQLSLAPGVGLPGRVWASAHATWVVDITKYPNSPRATVAERTGLRGGFAFPIRFGQEILGVVEFLSPETLGILAAPELQTWRDQLKPGSRTCLAAPSRSSNSSSSSPSSPF